MNIYIYTILYYDLLYYTILSHSMFLIRFQNIYIL